MNYIYAVGIAIAVLWLVALFPWLLLVVAIVWFVYLLGN